MGNENKVPFSSWFKGVLYNFFFHICVRSALPMVFAFIEETHDTVYTTQMNPI